MSDVEPDTDDGADDDAESQTDATVAADAAAEIDARGLLRDLVEIPSVSGDEREAAERLAAFFDDHGREVWIDEVGNVRAPADDRVLLTSHIDTVPGEIPVRVEDGELWGRGSVDATGPLAAMAAAAVATGVSFVGVVGEEADARGSRHLVETRDEPAALVNGEPSGWDGITLGYRGFLKGEFEATTPSAHTSRPGPNALEYAIDWWHEATGSFVEEADAPVFEQVTTKPVAMDGGVATDGLAYESSVTAQFRVPPAKTLEGVAGIVEDALPTYVGDGAAVTLDWIDSVPPTMQSPRNAVARAFRVAIRAAGGEPTHLRKTGTSDMNVYAGAWDCPMATYGPGDSSLDHAPDERIDLAAFDRSVDVLERVCEQLES